MFFSKIEDTFQISGRGLIVMVQVPSSDLNLRVNDQIQLRTPEGRILDTRVAAIEILCGPKVDPRLRAISLPSNITKQDVPRTMEVWLAQE
jgi:hypothetical protein